MRRSALRSVLTQALRAAVAAPLAVSAGCGFDVSSFNSPTCTAEGALSVEGLNPAVPVDYIELRAVQGDGQSTTFRTLSKSGTLCLTAKDKAQCQLNFQYATESNRGGFHQSCYPFCDWQILVTTRGEDVHVIAEGLSLDEFLAPYDTEQEAVFKLLTTDKYISCSDKSRGAVKTVAGGYEVVASSGGTCGGKGLFQHLLFVDSTGKVSERDSYQIAKGDPNCAIGRRPQGLSRCARKERRACTPLGRHFADSARLESASVIAFRVLRRELSAHGAPPRLLRSAARAARDEIRHTRTTARLASRHGARLLRPSIADRPVRPLEEIALENAAEGCVRETFGALVAMWQARHAQDRSIARAMARIAHDETRHAELAWEVASWLRPRLTPEAQQKVERVRREAIVALRQELLAPPAPELLAAAGMPTTSDALTLLAQLEQRLWA